MFLASSKQTYSNDTRVSRIVKHFGTAFRSVPAFVFPSTTTTLANRLANGDKVLRL